MTTVDTDTTNTRTTVDLEFRPATYWPEVTDRTRWLVSRVKGEARRRAAMAMMAAGGPVELEPWMVEHDIGREGKAALTWLDPGLRGGEDLPDLGREVEIARIWLTKTVHREVTSVRARPVGERIRYRVVDEYGECTPYSFVTTPKSSRRPLTLGQLVHLIDTAAIVGEEASGGGLVVPLWDDWMRYECDPETQRGSIEVSSDFYPQLGVCYEEKFERWLEARKRKAAAGSGSGRVVDITD
jgi:hypothetical protein